MVNALITAAFYILITNNCNQDILNALIKAEADFSIQNDNG